MNVLQIIKSRFSLFCLVAVFSSILVACNKDQNEEDIADPVSDPTACLLTKKFSASGNLLSEFFYDAEDRYFMRNNDTIYSYPNDSTVLGSTTGNVTATYFLSSDGNMNHYSDLWNYTDYFYGTDGFLSGSKKYSVTTNLLVSFDSLSWSGGNLMERKIYNIEANGDTVLYAHFTLTYSNLINYWQFDFIEGAPLPPFYVTSINLPASINIGTTTTTMSYVLDSGSKPTSMTSTNSGGSVTVSYTYSCN